MSLSNIRVELSPVDTSGATEPISLESGTPLNLFIFNDNIEDLTNVGVYIVPSTSLGQYNEQVDWPPETFYYNLIEYGDIAEGAETDGGLVITPPTRPSQRVTSLVGISELTKIGSVTITGNSFVVFELDLQNLPVPISSKIYFDLVVA